MFTFQKLFYLPNHLLSMMRAQKDEKEIGIEVFYTNSKGIGGKLRKTAQDFIVKELSSPPPRVDKGDYAILKIRVKKWETNRLIRQLSRQLGISRNRIGFAGTKDRRAITTQLISIRASLENVENINMKDVEVLESYASTKGLSLGDLLGNSFDITIRDIECSEKEAEKIISENLKVLNDLGGFPNFFGHQRFGVVRPITHLVGKKLMEGDFKGAVHTYLGNPQDVEGKDSFEARKALGEGVGYAEALKLFPKHLGFEKALLNHLINNEDDYIGAISSLPKNLSMMFVHAYQSFVFNRILSKRIESGLLTSEPLIGDLVLPLDSNGLPDHKKWIEVSQDNINKIKKRITEKKAFISCLVPGAEAGLAKGEQGEIEMRIIEEEKLSLEDFIIPQIKELSSKGMRRELVSPLRDFVYEIGGEGIRMKFKLLKGCYATALAREFMKTDMLRY